MLCAVWLPLHEDDRADGYVDGWMDRRIDGRRDGRMDGRRREEARRSPRAGRSVRARGDSEEEFEEGGLGGGARALWDVLLLLQSGSA